MAHIFGLPHSFGDVPEWLGIGGNGSGVGPPPLGWSGEVVDQFPALPGEGRTEVTIDNATGKCVAVRKCKSRKRKRRLATLSDIKDLAALKQVLGGGKAFDTWIATRGR